jgi:hypothetical protein
MSAVLLGSVRFLNQPPIKEGIKNVIGSITFFGGINLLYQMSKEPKTKETSEWWRPADKTVCFFLKASIVLSCIAAVQDSIFAIRFFI